MQPPSDYPLYPPDDLTPEGWLFTYDSQPRVIPRWPESTRMALVAVIVEDIATHAEADSAGYVLIKTAQANALVDFNNRLAGVGVLFFTVPRGRLLADEETCPGLNSDSWAI